MYGSPDIGVGPPTPDEDNRRASKPRRRVTRWAVGALVTVVGVALAGLLLGANNERATSKNNTDVPAAGTDQIAAATAVAAAPTTDVQIIDVDTPTVDALTIEGITDKLVIIESPDTVVVLDFADGTRTEWEAPEPLRPEPPVAVQGSVVVVGMQQAWVRSLAGDEWSAIGPADRVRFSTKPDRVWLRTLNQKTDPTDAEFLWTEADLEGRTYRSMFRNRPLYFPTPEFVSGLGSNIFRFTDAEINPWRLYSPFGVPLAIGRNDLIVRECNTRIECERVWYDLASGERRGSVYDDLAQSVAADYGTLLSPDGRFLASELERPSSTALAFIRSVATGRIVPNDCQWNSAFAFSSQSEIVACVTDDGVALYPTSERDDPRSDSGLPLALLNLERGGFTVALAFVEP